jgi:transcription elongation factor
VWGAKVRTGKIFDQWVPSGQLDTVEVYTGVGKSRFTVVHMEKDVQVMIITVAYKYEIITIVIIRQIIQ